MSRMPVEPNSLYTYTLGVTENFHYGFIHVDSAGNCSIHHWMQGKGVPKGYESSSLPEGACSKDWGVPVLGYFKVPYYKGDAVSDPKAFAEICAACGKRCPAVASGGTASKNFVKEVIKVFSDETRAGNMVDRVNDRTLVALAEARANEFYRCSIEMLEEE
ncbi:hypothetical protein R3P38DRAFT_8039 [Favolaschia claudopus]|uniref:Uncharacterized protein n=1 Tax=Favolaschia claudopus TaxID=2862362 RepID=A0AAW0EDD3_9AGAR